MNENIILFLNVLLIIFTTFYELFMGDNREHELEEVEK